MGPAFSPPSLCFCAHRLIMNVKGEQWWPEGVLLLFSHCLSGFFLTFWSEHLSEEGFCVFLEVGRKFGDAGSGQKYIVRSFCNAAF